MSDDPQLPHQSGYGLDNPQDFIHSSLLPDKSLALCGVKLEGNTVLPFQLVYRLPTCPTCSFKRRGKGQ